MIRDEMDNGIVKKVDTNMSQDELLKEYFGLVPPDNFEETFAQQFIEKFKSDFKQDKDEFVKIKSERLRQSDVDNREFELAVMYADKLFRYIHMREEKYELFMNEKLMNQLIHYDGEGGMCIYLSVVLYCLLYKAGYSEKSLGYWQGYYSAPMTQPVYKMLTKMEMTKGIHAFLTLDGTLIDMTIGQIEDRYVFEGHYFILGQELEGVEHFGFRETHDIVKEYARNFAKEVSMTYYEWVNAHYDTLKVFERQFYNR